MNNEILNRTYLNVPIGIKYISDWENFNLPQGHIIVNKIVTGCGFTEYCLNNNIPTILCSPRKALLGNKHRQHKTKGMPTYLYRNKYDQEENVDCSSNERLSIVNKVEDKNDILQYNRDLQNYIYQCTTSINVIPKILVTYDSLKHVLESINEIDPNLINNFQVVVDEFQSIFSDASFKASTELSFVDYLQGIPNVCYLSATPILDKYLEQLDEFKNLPYYELVWDSSMITKPVINRKKVKSIPEACYNIIQEYKNGIYPRKYHNNQIVESKEVVFFINSVTDICKIIKKADLKDYEVNIICAEDPKNLKKLKKAGINNFGTVPLEGDPHKMFTFCTRTVYLGTDFYSPTASTVICSDSNIDCMSLDISLDLPQIMGRQRLDENIFKHEAILFYKSTKTVLSEEDFEKFIQQKINETDTLLSEYNNMSAGGKVAYSKTLRENIIAYKYKNNFVGVSEKTGLAVYNKLVELSHRRAWEIQQLNYKDEVTVLKSLQEEGFNSKLYTEENLILIQEFLNEFNQDKNFERCMRLYCTFLDQYPFLFQIILKISDIPTTFHMYYELLGHSGIKSYAYKEYALRNEVEIKLQNPSVKEAILFNFQPGNKYSNKYVKEKLKEIYNQFNFNKSPKASDLEEYFLLKKVQFKEGDKRVDGFLIENIK
jgi:hypothetical protein